MNKKDKSKKSIAQKYWRTFEEFILVFLKDKYSIPKEYEEFCKLTPPTGDGGYDGILYVPISTMSSIPYYILFEAKLRTSIGQALPMNDFSKALIVAINRFANKLYIATNVHFSDETRHEINKYIERTGLSIELVTGDVLYSWYEKNMYKIDIDAQFADFLKRSARSLNTSASTISTVSQEHTIYIADNKRKGDIDKIVSTILKINSGVILIKGDKGSGKTLFSHQITHNLSEEGIIIGNIDIQKATTSRIIFLELLEIIWGISYDCVIECSDNDFEQMFNRIGNECIEEKSISILKQTLLNATDDYQAHWDIYHKILIDIVLKMFRYYSSSKSYCIHIENLDESYHESIFFYRKLCVVYKTFLLLF